MGAMSAKTLVVLAAGMGSRYGGLKQMDPVGPSGETILEYSVFDALRAGFGKAVFVIRREFEKPFKEMTAGWLQGRFAEQVSVEFVFQDLVDLPRGFTIPAGRTKPWGTTQAVLAAKGAVSTPFAVINADDFYGAASYEALTRHLDRGTAEYSMVGFRLRETLSDSGAVARGLCRVDRDGLLENIVELTSVERCAEGARSTDPSGRVTMLIGNETVSMNMWGFTPAVFDQLHNQFERFLETQGGDLKSESYLPNTVNRLIQGEQARVPIKVRVLKTSSQWFGVTYREDRAQVVEAIQRLVASGVYPSRLWT
jgi:NDP-sugar pyrophosphorylase family protein